MNQEVIDGAKGEGEQKQHGEDSEDEDQSFIA